MGSVGRWLQHQICGTMRTASAETQEENIGHIGRETVNGVPLGILATADSMDPYMSPAEEHPTNNRLPRISDVGSQRKRRLDLFLHFRYLSSHYINIIKDFIKIIIRTNILLISQCTFHKFGLFSTFIFLDWEIIFIILSRLLLLEHSFALQVQLAPLPSIRIPCTWIIKILKIKRPIVEAHVQY